VCGIVSVHNARENISVAARSFLPSFLAKKLGAEPNANGLQVPMRTSSTEIFAQPISIQILPIPNLLPDLAARNDASNVALSCFLESVDEPSKKRIK
jgi:hypothetical protein